MSKIFFTSDHHFGHANIIKFCNRPFENVEEMNEEMIRRWNEKVKLEDTVYHLGDFGFKNKTNLANILYRLNGKKYLIIGNHEGAALSNSKHFQWTKEYFELKVPDPTLKNGIQRIILFHYAMRVWRGDSRGAWHLYGHSHGNLPDEEHRQAFDVGVDNHDFYPLSYEEVKEIMSKKSWTPPPRDREVKPKLEENKTQ